MALTFNRIQTLRYILCLRMERGYTKPFFVKYYGRN